MEDLAHADACVVVLFEELGNSHESLFIIHLWDGCKVTPRLPEVSLQVIHMGGIRSEEVFSKATTHVNTHFDIRGLGLS